MKKLTVFSLFFLIFFSFGLQAAMKSKTFDFLDFNCIKASNNLQIEIIADSKKLNTVEASVDEVLFDYLIVEVKGETLYLGLDEKSYAPELKKSLKGKNAINPEAKLTVYIKSSLKKLEITDEVIVNFPGRVDFTSDFKMIMSKKSKLLDFNVNVPSCNFNLSDKATVSSVTLVADKCEISASKNSMSKFNLTSSTINIKTEGSAELAIRANPVSKDRKEAQLSVLVESKGQSKVVIDGKAYIFNIKASNGSIVDAEQFYCSKIITDLSNNSTAVICFNDNDENNSLEISSIDGGKLYYANNSNHIKINKINNGTVLPSKNYKRK